MNISDLISELEALQDDYGDVEVRLMTQQSWPFENTIHGVVSNRDFTDEDEINEEEDLRFQMADPDLTPGEQGEAAAKLDALLAEQEARPVVVYITEGSQLGYGSKQAWRA